MTDTNNSPLEGNVLFYTNPEPLDQSVHGGLGVNPSDKPYAFVAQTNIVPLTVTEFAAAALSYPIIFTGENRQPVAVMGLSSNENLFVAPDGEFRADAYVPAYVRRYPFVFADDKQNQRLILCIDRGASIVAEDGQAAKPPTVYRALEFLERLGMVHRIASISAYVASTDDGEAAHAAAFLICDCCGATREVAIGEDDRLHQAAHEAGYAVQRTTIEAHGRCAACREAA